MTTSIAWEVMTSYAQALRIRFVMRAGAHKAPVAMDRVDALLVLQEDLRARARRLSEAVTGPIDPSRLEADTALWSCALIGALTDLVGERAGVSLDTRARAAARAARGLVGQVRSRAIRQFLAARPAIIVALVPADLVALSPSSLGALPPAAPAARSIQMVTSRGEVTAFPEYPTPIAGRAGPSTQGAL